MRKTLGLFFLIALCVALLVGCATSGAPEVKTDSGLTAAKNYLWAMYKDKAEVTPSDYQVVGLVNINGISYNIEWTVDVADGVKIVPDGKMVTIDVNEKTNKEISYTLTATIKDAEGQSVSVSFPHKVPAFKELSFAEYASAPAGESVVVKGVVTGIMAKSKGNSSNCLYFQDSDGGYYAYNLASDPIADLKIEEGQTIRITGAKDIYSGTYEVINSSVEILDANKTPVLPVDYTEKYKNASSLKDASLVAQQAMLVTVKGVEVTGQDVGSGYYKFKMGGLESYVRISSSVCPIDKAAQTAFIAGHAEHLGWTANVTGVLCVYDGAFYLTPVSADAFEYVSLPAKDAAAMVAFEKENLVLSTAITEDTTIALPATGKGYSDVEITWASNNGCAVVEDGKLVITLPENGATVKILATLKSGSSVDTKVFELKVDAVASDIYIVKEVEGDSVMGVPYKFYLTQANLGKTLYFTGEMNGKYLASSDKADNAVDVMLEESGDGLRLYFVKDDVKTYIEIYEYAAGKAGVQLTAEPKNVFKHNADIDVLTTEIAGVQYYLGTYKTYDTISVSDIKYISGDNAQYVGVSQFPTHIGTLQNAMYQRTVIDAPKAGHSYYFALGQVNLGKDLYLTGEMTGNYLATTDKVQKAAKVFLEESEGGYRLFTGSEDKKNYVEIYEYTEGKVGVHMTTEPTTVYRYDADCQTLVANVAGFDYYLGTYKTYNTISASKTSYITGENAKNVGVSQFPAQLSKVEAVEVQNVVLTAPEFGANVKYALVQANLGKTLYFAGSMSGNYLATTEKLSKATDVFIEEAEGGFRLYFNDGTKKVYIETYEYTAGKVGVHLTEEPTTVYAWNADFNIPVTNLLDTQYYLGTYKTYNTISASKISYINSENIGVSQFPAQLNKVGFVK